LEVEEVKYEIATLEGSLLDAAVAKAEGLLIDGIRRGDDCVVGETPNRYVFAPSRSWAQGGSIIERERISSRCDEDGYSTPEEPWCAECGVFWTIGPTLLIAAMRAYVASKLGEEVDLPLKLAW
jgi:hypothetical protein